MSGYFRDLDSKMNKNLTLLANMAKIDLLVENPLTLQSKQLTGYPTLRRIKSGEYRIIYQINNDILEILVLRIGKRNDAEVYRQLGHLV
ncbi:type II toxin-antitoxin system RelE family toxin [Lonepinella koalarum]|uniref:type II toxin-antitoxin system RelE family toxin n=1 Tax=Lonepinella koalarum TaxID=53417 RepID=UPI00226BBF35|nr:type II toxin-antitoxin system RelE/ParE family toxin [Lonepinella koalarum]